MQNEYELFEERLKKHLRRPLTTAWLRAHDKRMLLKTKARVRSLLITGPGDSTMDARQHNKAIQQALKMIDYNILMSGK